MRDENEGINGRRKFERRAYAKKKGVHRFFRDL